MEPNILIKEVNFTYNKGKDNEFQALINVSLQIYPEEFVIIFGPSGCGKSTMLNIIAGLETPDNGNINVLGRDLMTMTKNEFAMYHRAQIGMVYQAYNLITSLSVLDNVALPQIFVNAGKRKREKWAMSLLERFGIDKQYKKIPTELSGGQQQRIGIARAIVNNPQIVLADEPVGNLDSVSAKNVLDILCELNEKEKKTVIMVTHNPENLVYGDRIIYMKDGVIVREVINREKNKEQKKEMFIKTKTPVVEIKDLMRTYQGLSPEQINILIMPYKAKVFTHHFISSRNMEEAKSFEEVIQRKLLGTISNEEFFDILHRSSLEGGVGYNKQAADKIVRRVNRLIRITYFIYQKIRQRKNIEGQHDTVKPEEKTKKVTDYLLDTCYKEHRLNLDAEQINRLEQAIGERILGNTQKTDFFKKLDASYKDGGVGLNTKTAQAISEEMELILILGFGISHKTKIPKLVLSKLNISSASENSGSKDKDAAKPIAEVPESGSDKNESGKDNIEKVIADRWSSQNNLPKDIVEEPAEIKTAAKLNQTSRKLRL
jgi:putative ABC transport system ATP-binding protein